MPFGGSRPNYQKLRTNLRLCINRLKLLEKKKTELALKSRKEIADYIQAGKDDRARIRVEHIIREDYMVEAMEIIEMFCDLLLARYGIVEKMKEMDPGLEEPISTILWASPRLMSDVPEIAEVSKQLSVKYGKEFMEASRQNTLETVNEKVLVKMSVASPPKKLIEQYMMEIAKSFNVPFEPDPSALMDENIPSVDSLIDLAPDPKPPGGGGGGGGLPAGMVDTMPAPAPGFMPPMQYPNASGYAPPFTMPAQPQMPAHQGAVGPASQPPPLPFQHPNAHYGVPPALPPQPPVGAVGGNHPNEIPRLPSYDEVLDENASNSLKTGSGSNSFQSPSAPPNASAGLPPALPSVPPAGGVPVLPSVPNDSMGPAGHDDIDFDDLTKRFEELKKKKVPTATLR